MKHLSVLALIAIFALIEAVPVPPKTTKAPPTPDAQEKESIADNLLPFVSYKEYLAEVVKVLENDKEFTERVQKLNGTTDLAHQLEFASHSVRTRLDEIKRQEVERLNALEKMLEAKLAAKGDPQKAASVPVQPEVMNMDAGTIKRAHLDHENPHSFEIEDLQRLIRQVTDDMRQVEVAKEEEYKRYEMSKEHAKKERLRRIKDAKARLAAEQKMREEQANHRKHQKIHQPGSREQLKDAWEQEDHMDKDNFDPRTFFMMHDINGDGHLDLTEIEAIFIKELDKVYANSNDTTVDVVEREHEMERMRRTVMDKVDTNKDFMVSWPEFEKWVSSQDARKDEDWQTTEEKDDRPFKDDEFKQFEEDYQRQHPEETQVESPPHASVDHPAPPADHPVPQGDHQVPPNDHQVPPGDHKAPVGAGH